MQTAFGHRQPLGRRRYAQPRFRQLHGFRPKFRRVFPLRYAFHFFLHSFHFTNQRTLFFPTDVSALVGEYVGLEAVDDGRWDVYFGMKKLGRLDERHMRIEDEWGRLKRCDRQPRSRELQ
jgi:hypothetical protein